MQHRSTVINHILTTHKGHTDVAIAWVYCNYNNRTTQTATNLAGSLSKQLFQRYNAGHGRVKSLYDRHKNQVTMPSLEELRTILRSQIVKFNKVFLVFDALDECCEIDGTLAKLVALLQYLATYANVLVTSRILNSIERALRGSKRLEIKADDRDVQEYVRSRIHGSHRLQKYLQGNPVLHAEAIVEKVSGNAKDM